MRKPLLHERCKNGLYPLPMVALSSSRSPSKYVLAIMKPTMVQWHYHLGHASSPIVQHVARQNNLSYLKENLDESVCDAYQKAKSHHSIAFSQVLECVYCSSSTCVL
jgi:hypothetical protein